MNIKKLTYNLKNDLVERSVHHVIFSAVAEAVQLFIQNVITCPHVSGDSGMQIRNFYGGKFFNTIRVQNRVNGRIRIFLNSITLPNIGSSLYSVNGACYDRKN